MLGTKWITEWESGDTVDPGRNKSPEAKPRATPRTPHGETELPFLSLEISVQGLEGTL